MYLVTCPGCHVDVESHQVEGYYKTQAEMENSVSPDDYWSRLIAVDDKLQQMQRKVDDQMPKVLHFFCYHSLDTCYFFDPDVRLCLIWFISRAFCETIRMTFGVCVCVCVCMCVCVCVCVQGISPSITGRILMKLRMDIPVHHAQCVWQTI